MAQNVLEYLLTIKDQASDQLKKFSSQAETMGKSLDGVGSSLNKAGIGMVKLGAGGVAALGLATKTAIEFESTFAGVRKTVDATEEEFAQLEKNIREIAKTTPASTSELNKIGELAGQLGVSGVGNLTKFIDTIAKIGVTTNLSSEEAATSFARIANIMQEPIDNVDKMASVVVDLGNNFATTESEIVNFANRIAGAGNIAGLSTDEIFGISAAFSSVGVEAEAGGTAVQKVLIAMNTAVAQGNSDLAIFAETAGATAEEFAEAWKGGDAEVAFQDFVLGLGKQGGDAIGTLEELGLQDQRLVRSFLSLANAGGLVEDALNKSGTAWNENTAAAIEAEKRFATTESQLAIMRNNIADIGITMGAELLPRLNDFIEKMKPVIEGITKFIAENPKLVVTILGVISAIGVLGGVLIFIGQMFMALGAILPVVGAAIGFITWPMLVVAGVIALLIGLGYLIYKNWDLIKEKAMELGKAIKEGVLAGVEKLKGAFNKAKDMVSNFGANLKTGASNANNGMREFFANTYKGAVEGLKQAFTKVGTVIKGLISLIFKGDFTGEFGRAIGLDEDSPIIYGFLRFRDAVINIFKTFVEGVMISLQPFIWMWDNLIFPPLFLAFAVIARILYELFNVFVIVFTAIKEAVVSIATGIWNGLVTVFTALKEWLVTFFTALWNEVLLPVLTIIKDGFIMMWNTIRDFTIAVWNGIKEFFLMLWTELVAIFTGIWNALVEIFTALWDSVKEIWSGIWSTIVEWATQVGTSLNDKITKAKEIVLNIFNALWEGLKSIGTKIFNAIVEPFERAKAKIEEIATAIKEAARKISPFHKESPSLVELVNSGVNRIKRDYDTLNSIRIPSAQQLSGVDTFQPMYDVTKGAGNQSTVNNTINVEATINSDMDAQELALMLGNQLAVAKAY